MGPQVFTYENGAYRVESNFHIFVISNFDKTCRRESKYLSEKVSKVRNIALNTISSCKTFSRNYFRYSSY